jgi:hypothetical protein
MELRGPANKQVEKKPHKRSYKTPQLFSYGNIREITRNAGPKGALDNGGGAAAGPKTGT